MYILNMKEIISNSEPDVEEKAFSCFVNVQDNLKELNDVSSKELFNTDKIIDINCGPNENVSVRENGSFDRYEESYEFANNSNLGMFSDKTLQAYSLAQCHGYVKKTLLELESYSVKELQILHEDLVHTVEAVSSELVQLLLENDSLQQESDARNVAIEQLLKMTVKNTENELRPIQMSVILPEEKSDEKDSINES